VGSPQFAASEIAADEIAANNQPPMQRTENLNRCLAFRRPEFTPTHKKPLRQYAAIVIVKVTVLNIFSTLKIKNQ